MLSIEKCSKTLNKNNKNRFTEKEVTTIRDLLYKMARIVIENNTNK
jgi:hypothetical protein